MDRGRACSVEQTRARGRPRHVHTNRGIGSRGCRVSLCAKKIIAKKQSQAGYEVSPQLYSTQVSPKFYNSRTVSQGSVYRLPSTSSASYYPSSQTYTQYTSAPRVQYRVQAAPAYSQVSVPALYNAEHSEHASSSSHYRLQAALPAALTLAQPSAQYAQPSAQYVQSATQYVQPSSAQYVQSSSTQHVQPSVQYVQSNAQYAQPSWQQGSWTANNPWC
ncbi:hypothetical protein RR48_05675 [Papilio machaon]|uniref:Uncharacterized protein n=1 Tax=Papilio machaon TaxID=76193 RepID=A0A0N0PD88_PAPMA|nr:hypothetical protein RR48_05675 [Papilio machaon]